MRQIVCFVRICELGSISRAAAELNIAQPALGLQLRSLEHDFGTDLVVRSSRGVTPTKAGEIVLAHSQELIRQDRELRVRLKELNQGGPVRLTLALTASLVNMLAGAVIERVRVEMPDTLLVVMEGASEVIIQWVEEERVDLGLGFGDFTARHVEGVPILKERLFYVEASQSQDTEVSLREVLQKTLVLPNEQNSIRHTLEAAAQDLDVPLVGSYELGSLDAIRAITRRGIAGAIVPYGGIAEDVIRGELNARLIGSPRLERTMHCWRRTDHTPTRSETLLRQIVTGELSRVTRDEAPPGAYVFLDEP
jgi:LysR family nitrogen assimilation transcriptional regulator